MKIVSLIPSATEIVFALGLGDQLAGVTFECDYPPAARSKPAVSSSALTAAELTTPRGIDDAVAAKVAAGEPLYALDAARIATIQPDLILAQDLCRVCAVPSGAVEAALDVLGCRADVISLDPSTLDDVIDCIGVVGDATGTADTARSLMDHLRERLDTVRDAVRGRSRPRTLALEWSDPPFSGGHWVPEMIASAGGEPVLSVTGVPSRRLTWDEIASETTDAVVFMPCGYGLEEAVHEGQRLLAQPELADVRHLYAVDATAYFSRPGPRLVDGVEILAAALHPEAVPPTSPAALRVLR